LRLTREQSEQGQSISKNRMRFTCPYKPLYVNLTPNGPRSLFPLIQPERQSDVPLGSVMALLTP